MAGSLSLLHHRLSCQGLVFNLIIKGLSKNFSFWTVSLDLDAMFKIKSLLYKDLILNSRGCPESNQLLGHPQATIRKCQPIQTSSRSHLLVIIRRMIFDFSKQLYEFFGFSPFNKLFKRRIYRFFFCAVPADFISGIE